MGDALVVVLSVVALVAVAVEAAAHVRVHLLPTDPSPLRDAVSDYGVGPYRAWYRTTVVGLRPADSTAAQVPRRTFTGRDNYPSRGTR